MSDDQQPRVDHLHARERELALQQRQRTRDRRKVIGLLAIAFFILVLAFIRFGRHIPWSAR